MESGTAYVCGCCTERKTETNPHFAVPGDETSFVCHNCCFEHIIPQFQEALKYEHHWPPKWAEHTVSIDTFADLLDPVSANAYRVKEIEYRTPPGERVYCPHQLVVLERDHPSLEETREARSTFERCNSFIGRRGNGGSFCGRCGEGVCTNCEATIKVNTMHACPGQLQPNDTGDGPFDGLQRGIKWQQCPSCGRKCERAAGCNEITCKCEEHFCFLCGKGVPVDERREHWTMAAGCPRYRDHTAEDLDEEDYDLEESDDELDIPGDVDEDVLHALIADWSSPESDNDFVGAALENDAMVANEPNPDPRRPTLAEFRSAFNAVHNNPVANANPEDNIHYVDLVRYLQADRFEVHRAINANLQVVEALEDNPPPGNVGVEERLVERVNLTNLLFALQAFISTVLILFTNADADLGNAHHALILQRFEVNRWATVTIAEDLAPEVEEILQSRIVDSYLLQELIRRLLDERAAQAIVPPANMDVIEPSSPSEGSTPHAADSP